MEYLLYRIIVSTYTIADNFMSVGTERDFIKRLFRKLYIFTTTSILKTSGNSNIKNTYNGSRSLVQNILISIYY